MNRTLHLRLLRPAYGALAAMRNLALLLVMLAACTTPTDATNTPETTPETATGLRILALGDSLVQGYGLPEPDGFVPQLQAWLAANGAPDVAVINAGVSGDTTAGGLARIDWTLAEPADAVIVVLGGNDMLRGIDPALVRTNLDGILARIGASGLPVLLAGIPAVPNYGEDYASAFRAVYPDLAAKHGAILYRSFFAGMGGGRSPREVQALMQPDGIHPSAEGVRLIVDHMGPSVLELIAVARASR
jgi:acyl-CoA thioesterase-1